MKKYEIIVSTSGDPRLGKLMFATTLEKVQERWSILTASVMKDVEDGSRSILEATDSVLIAREEKGYYKGRVNMWSIVEVNC